MPRSARPARSRATPSDPRLGVTLGGYRVESMLGRGGMSVVYLASDLALGRKVALKLLSPELSQDAEFRKRFARESKLAASLDHPNIVPIYRAGEEDEVLYIAMRYVEGTDLGTLIKTEAPLEALEALAILSQVAGALDVAHEKGMVHRDVKPGNILLSPTGKGFLHAYLTDFGLTKRTSSTTSLTRSGVFLGTIDYAAPEQIEGRPLDGRADLYGLACVAYQCLTGRVPFERDTELGVLWAHLYDDPPKVSSHRPDVSSGLDGVIARGLAKSSEDRFASCGELTEALARYSGRAEGKGATLARRPGRSGAPPKAYRYDIFLSHHREDSQAVEKVAAQLKQAGLEPWLPAWAGPPEDGWRERLEAAVSSSAACAVFIGPGGLGDWEREELRIARTQTASRNLRLIPVLLPGLPDPLDPGALPPFLSSRSWVDLRGGVADEASLDALVLAVRGMPSRQLRRQARTDTSPYRGLEAFDEEHAEFFFGREGDVQRLVELLKAGRFLAVVGPSGTGKSSLVRAGLVPALKAGVLPGSKDWTINVLKPGPQPLTGLVAHLVHLLPHQSMQSTLDRIAADPRTLHLAAALAVTEGAAMERVVWVVDQFEEVFTLCRDPAERSACIANLLYAAAAPHGRSITVLTMRADFYPRCAAYPELARAMSADQFLVSPMDNEGLRRAVEGPAIVSGLHFEEGLADTILGDVRDQPGVLPLLEHALLELWERRQGPLLTLEGYAETGGVQGAVAKRGEAVYLSLSEDEQVIARRILLRLTQPGEGTEDTRRRARASELATRPEDVQGVDRVLDAFVRARLLTISGAERSGERWVDVSHEALIRTWPRLRTWLDEDRAGLRLHRRLTEAAQEWERLERDKAVLYRGIRLAEAVDWQGRESGVLNELERAFLRASMELQERERREADERQQKELADAQKIAAGQRRVTRLFRWVAVVLVLGLIGSGVGALIAVGQKRSADRQSRVALSRELAAQAFSQLPLDPGLSTVLAIRAAEVSPTHEAELALRRALAESHERAVIRGVTLAKFSPDGKLVATVNGGTVIYLRELPGGRVVKSLGDQRRFPILDFEFSPDGKLLATGSGNGVIRVWDVATARLLLELRGEKTDHLTNDLEFSPEGRLIAASSGGPVRFWNVETGRPEGVLSNPPAGNLTYRLTFSPDGKTLLTFTTAPAQDVWDVATGQKIASLEIPTEVFEAAFSPDGEQLVTASGGDPSEASSVGIWDATTWRLERVVSQDHGGLIFDVDHSPDGTFFITASQDKTVRIRDARDGRTLRVLRGHLSGVTSADVSPDGQRIITASEDGTARVWNTATGQTLAVLRGHRARVHRAEFSPDGRFVLTVSEEETARIWEISTGKPPVALNGHTLPVGTVSFDEAGNRLVTGSDDGTARVWEIASGRIRRVLRHPSPVRAADFSPDGRFLVTGDEQAMVRVWDLASGRTVTQIPHPMPVRAAAFMTDGKSIATGFDVSAGGATVWDARTGNPLLAATSFAPAPTVAVDVSQDGRLLVFVTQSGIAEAYRLFPGQDKAIKLRDEEYVSELFDGEISPDGRFVILAGGDGTARLWDPMADTIVRVFEHPASVLSAAFSPDGLFIVTGSEDGVARVWDRELDVPVVKLDTGSPIRAIDFGPGRQLVAAGDDGVVRIFPCSLCGSIEDLLAIARARTSRALTAEERAEFLHEAQTQPSSDAVSGQPHAADSVHTVRPGVLQPGPLTAGLYTFDFGESRLVFGLGPSWVNTIAEPDVVFDLVRNTHPWQGITVFVTSGGVRDAVQTVQTARMVKVLSKLRTAVGSLHGTSIDVSVARHAKDRVDVFPLGEEQSSFVLLPGEKARFLILDWNSRTIVIALEADRADFDELVERAEQVLSSMRFE
jgi:WD40 repeat protein